MFVRGFGFRNFDSFELYVGPGNTKEYNLDALDECSGYLLLFCCICPKVLSNQ